MSGLDIDVSGEPARGQCTRASDHATGRWPKRPPLHNSRRRSALGQERDGGV